MNIKILQLLDGAKKATGLTVIIDVFRAFSVEAYLFNGGAEKIIPVADLDVAYKYKKDFPSALLVGERDGKICEGFDYGNCPSDIKNINIKNKTVIHTTSAGTQGLFGADKAEVVLGAGLVNAAATAEYIKQSGYTNISLVCMGLAAIKLTEEDTLCANYIKSILENDPIDLEEEIENLKYTSGAKFFDKTQNDVFPREDFYLCTDVDCFDFAIKLIKSDNGLSYMQKEKISW
ncbi:MAG: 2-phosphosulfolactate phosphatase [Ruminococcaceae bacterium]|nr:2-phosphosulfolactate phosphatase [Oscillospiraceae bacterium]